MSYFLKRFMCLSVSLAILNCIFLANASAQTRSRNSKVLNKKFEQKVQEEQTQKLKEVKANLDQEAIQAYEDTSKALNALKNNKKEEALKALERASGKFNVILERNPELAAIIRRKSFRVQS